MSCIIGIVDEEHVYMGGDRGASDDVSIVSIHTPKIFVRGNWIIGYCGSIGIGQLIEFIDLEDDVENPYTYIRLSIVEALRNAMESFGNTPQEHDTGWMIGYKGRLFELSAEDWGVVEVEESAMGSGGTFALGSLHTTKQFPVALPTYRIEQALGAAITYSPTCQGPIDILSV